MIGGDSMHVSPGGGDLEHSRGGEIHVFPMTANCSAVGGRRFLVAAEA